MLQPHGRQDSCAGASDVAMTGARPATRMPRALVTGGAGFIGSHLCERLLFEGYEVACMDNLSTGSFENVASLLAREADFEYIDHDVSVHIDFPGEPGRFRTHLHRDTQGRQWVPTTPSGWPAPEGPALCSPPLRRSTATRSCI